MFSKLLELQLFSLKQRKPAVTFATSCYEGDYERVLVKNFLEKKIENHSFPFAKKVLIINNVKNREKVLDRAKSLGVFTEIHFAEENILDFFALKRKDFKAGTDKHLYPNVDDNWIFFNALAPLAAIYHLDTPYLLYCTGDVYLEKRISWIEEALFLLRKKKIKVANLCWNGKVEEARLESYRKKRSFFIAKEGFSDQMFLIKREDFQKPIYSEIRKDSTHFPRGDVFEKRVFSYMKNRGWERITYKNGSYTHE